MNPPPTALHMARRPAASAGAEDAAGRAGVLGFIGYGRPAGAAAAAHAPWPTRIAVRPLLDHTLRDDVWSTPAPLHQGQTGVVRWRAGAQWLFGAADLDAADEASAGGAGGGTEAVAHRVYADLFATLREHGNPALLRLWNYLPRITSDGGGLERYRQFNIGRQRAFLEAGQAAFEGAPAACALGLRTGGGLSLRFVAGHTPVRALENPRQVPAYRYPERYGPRAPTFSRAALAPLGEGMLALLVSGTASIVGHESLHAGDTLAQLDETLRNLRALIEAARAQSSAPFSLEDSSPVIYLRHAHEAPAVRERLAQALGGPSRFMREALFLEADICRPELDIEIETLACARGELAAS